MDISKKKIELLKATKLQNGSTAYDYVMSWSEKERQWALAGVLSCIEKGYSLNRLTINWEARELRYREKIIEQFN